MRKRTTIITIKIDEKLNFSKPVEVECGMKLGGNINVVSILLLKR